ncbi:MAG: hypothetical protein ACRC6U_11495 [Fusobacteriaceae bacterium]
MVDFKLIDQYIEIIENNSVPEGKTFNQFAVEFFKLTQTVPLSKYLRKIDKTTKLPKIMNTKKAGEVISTSEKDDEVKSFLKRKGYKETPQLNYKSVMLLRKVEPILNWNKIFQFFDGKGSVQEINSSSKPKLLPVEVEKLEEYVKAELKLNEQDFNWLLNKMNKISQDKSLEKSLKKLINNHFN